MTARLDDVEAREAPLVCMCAKARPIPGGLGECRKCRRLIIQYAYVDGLRPKMP